MANTGSSSSVRRNAFCGVGLFCLLVLAPLVCATQYRVGGSIGWGVPTEPDAYDRWAKKMRFQIGDSLSFVYIPDKDSVLQVSKEDYDTCNTKSPIATFDDGNTVFMFNQSGPYYFISGVQENCLKKEALVVVVMADRSSRSSGSNSPPPPPSGSIQFVPSPPLPRSGAAAPLKAIGAICSVGALLSSSLFFGL